MKKILALILAVSMLFCFAACGMFNEKDDDDVKGSVKNSSGELVDAEAAFSLGKTEGSDYENKFLGLGFKIANGWSFYSEEQIAELNGITEEMLDEDLADALEESNYFYDVFAHSTDQKSSINIVFEKKTKRIVEKLDLEESAEISLQGVIDTYKNMGLSDMKSEIKKVNIDGEKYTGFTLTSSLGDTTLYQTCFMVKRENYIVSVSASATSEAELNDLIESFYHL